MAPSPPLRRPSPPPGRGFTITELLIYVALGTVIAAAAAVNVITNIRTASNLELRQRAVDEFGRLNFFLQSEVSEGQSIKYGAAEPLPGGCGPGQQLFSIEVPYRVNNTPRQTYIHFYARNNGTELWRCGPPIDANGRLAILDGGGNPTFLDAKVNNNTRLTVFNTPPDPQSVSYALQFLSSSGAVTLSRGSASIPLVARTGVRSID